MKPWLVSLSTLLLLPALAGADVEIRSGDLTWRLSGEARFRPEWRNDLDLNERVDDDSFQGLMRLRVGMGAAYKDQFEVFLQMQDSRLAGEELSTASNEQNVDLHQGWLRLRGLGLEQLSLTLGRQVWIYGEQRLIGGFDWDNVSRSFDGLKLRYEGKAWWIDGLLARVTSRNAVDPNTREILTRTTGSDLWGLQSQWNPEGGREYGAYWLGFSNHERGPGEGFDPNTGTGPVGDTTVHAIGGRMKQRFGQVDLNLEAVAQTGEINGDDLSAHAAAIQVGVTLGEEVKWRPFAGYDLATGDEDPGDGDREEFFNFFPTNHLHYGYADLEGWRNIQSPYVGGSVSVGRHVVLVKAHQFRLDEEAGPWKSAGGAVLGFDPSGASGSRVGSEVDLIYKLAFREKSRFEAGLTRFEPGRFARLTRGDDPTWWGYLMLIASF